MRREKQFRKIEEALLLEQTKITLNSRMNLLDGNIFSEDFYRDMLNIIYGYDLINANELIQNMGGFDLIFTDKKVLYQVTATASTTKIKKTLENKNIKSYDDYTLYFVFIGTCDNSFSNTIFDVKHVKFDPEQNIITLPTLLKKILHLEQEKMDKLYKLIIDNPEMNTAEISADKLSSSLAKITAILSRQHLGEYSKRDIPLPFDFEEKIKCNNLKIIRDSIVRKNNFYQLMQSIYDTYDQESINTSLSVWEKIRGFSEDAQLADDELEGVQLFKKINELCCGYIIQNLESMQYDREVIEFCVSIIVTDAFLRCKIMKRPEEVDEHVASN